MIENLNNSDNLCILVVSCDHYADAWQPFFDNFFSYWPDCPYPIYLQTNLLKPNFSNVSVIAVGPDVDWSTNLSSALSQLPTNNVLLLLEDFWLWQPVNTILINKLYQIFKERNAGYLRLVPKPPADQDLKTSLPVGLLLPDSAYRVSYQAGIWDKKVLNNILLPGENAWASEMQGSKRSRLLDAVFLSVLSLPVEEWPIRYLNAIIKCKWTPEAVALAKERQIIIDFSKRKACHWYDQLRRKRFFRISIEIAIKFLRMFIGERLYLKVKKFPLLKKLIY